MNNPPPAPAPVGLGAAHMVADQSQQLVEAASPISSRPPAPNSDEFLPLSAGGLPPDDGDEADRAGGSSGGGGGNRWPRQETLALLRIRSEMDATFRDASLKGPLWEDVSRKLCELGYKRSAKKCKEKFENVHKYYKRTKEGRAGRQDGKSYKFFTELEALHGVATPTATASRPAIASPPPSTTTATTASQANFIVSSSPAPPPPVSINPMPISSIRFPPNSFSSPTPLSQPPQLSGISPAFQTGSAVPGGATSISTNSASTSPMSEDDEDEDYDLQGGPENAGSSRKRKRGKGAGGGTRRMMDFFEGLMKQVMQKQELMQQRFLEAVEKREQDRMIREEAWKRQEMARLSRDQEVAAQERAISASRDAAIISFLQKITGQTIQFPAAPPPPPSPAPVPAPPPQQQQDHHHHQPSQQHVHHQQKRQTQGATEVVRPQQADVVMAVPEQQVPPQEPGSGGGGGGSFEAASSSRWPKAEVLALINLRSGLEVRYQEVGPKGPLWEEISSGMKRLGYNRSSKRCKEKWENINKYFKKVKESSKKRPEDAKTCPYFHQLDALYRRKILISNSGGGSSTSLSHHQEESVKKPATEPENTNGARSETTQQASNVAMAAANLFGESTPKKPEDIVKELMAQQQLMVDDYDKVGEGDSDDIEDDEDEDEELEEERKMDYKIEFQRQNTTGPSNGGGNGAPSFLAMVQ